MAPEEKPPINVDYFEDLTGDIASCDDACREQIGDRIRKLREEKGLTLADLSQLTGFEATMLADIESNAISPQLGTIIKLSKALDSALQRLLSGEGQKLYAVTRKDERKVVSRSSAASGARAAYTYMSLAPEVVVLGGGVMESGEPLLGVLRNRLPLYAIGEMIGSVRIRTASLGHRAGAIGAALYARTAHTSGSDVA